MTPTFAVVVAPNDDTLYAGTFVDLSAGPVVLTVPSTATTWSLFTSDVFGNTFTSEVPNDTAGTYALVPPGFTGTLPPGLTRIDVPYTDTLWALRVDKFVNGIDRTAAAEQFRKELHLAALSDYLNDPTTGATELIRVSEYGVRFKVLADNETQHNPISFLAQLQTAMHSPTTVPLNASDVALSQHFDKLFGKGAIASPALRDEFEQATRDEHAAIIANYLDHTGPTNWIHFTDIGRWGTNYLNRSSTTEFLQWGNDIDTAAYYHAFKDGSGAQLDASTHGYVMTFPAGQIPEASRFWSITAYLPRSITLVPNVLDKYVVASYTPGLVTNADGSISIYMAPSLPPGAPTSNWLPAPQGKFNIMLRVYGPEGNVADDTYIPPAITPL
ncbi:DUF1254 domain-containing protein [Streptomyces marianii]|uniref:DUF1254 domain-containing protein n=2 Tax=Streptomyces marianii TaxID=1817406 RepID=A0A5R9ECQ7_9ACTN|nr:DUF1254 domain-containing protein [Streptomyces marianii]